MLQPLALDDDPIGEGSFNKVRVVQGLDGVVARTCTRDDLFQRELRLLRLVQGCAGVVALVDSDGYKLPRRTLLLEHLGGGTLLTMNSDSSPAFGTDLPGVATVLRVARQLLWALAAVHRRGVAHLDVKGTNIMIDRPTTDPNWQLKLIDFGLATAVTAPVDAVVRGTEMMMPPERLDADGRALHRKKKGAVVRRFMAPGTAAAHAYQKQDSWAAGITVLEFAHFKCSEELGVDVMVLHQRDELVFTDERGYCWADPTQSLTQCLLGARKECSALFPVIDGLCQPSLLDRALPQAAQIQLLDIETGLGFARRRPLRRRLSGLGDPESVPRRACALL